MENGITMSIPKVTKSELARLVVKDMAFDDVVEIAISGLIDFYNNNPKDFQAAAQDYLT